MLEHTLFHPVVESTSLAGIPLSIVLLGQPVVLWRDQQGQPLAWADRCPHRGTKLSMGRVVEGQLECPYHGWRFGASARCTHIPALPDFAPPPTHCAQAYPLREAYGLLWVSLSPTAAQPPAFAAEADTHLRKTLCGPYDVATSAPRIVENFLDMAHFGFVHEGWLGDRTHTAMEPYAVTERSDGVLATQCMAWQPKSSIHATGGAMIEYTYEVTHPYTAVLTKAPEPGGAAIAQFRESIALFVCPIEAERSRVWFRLAMNDFNSPDETLRAFQDTIFGQDKPILESQTPKMLPLQPHSELHCAADRMSVAYRRYLARLGVTVGVC
jgi:phenylpropionate dioxygenase-like ring-hydroxylating dioxygenase large terminal subunit